VSHIYESVSKSFQTLDPGQILISNSCRKVSKVMLSLKQMDQLLSAYHIYIYILTVM